MLQLMEKATTVFNVKEIIKLQKLRPLAVHTNTVHCICTRCRYVNDVANNFCTNCGYPIKEERTSTLYHVRVKQRKELLKKSEKDVEAARITLYALSVFFLIGISFLFGDLDNRYLLVLVSA